MNGSTRWIGIGLVTLFLGLAIGGGIAWIGLSLQSPAGLLAEGENCFQAGIRAFAAHDDAKALVQFHSAQLYAEQALQATDELMKAKADPRLQQLLAHGEGLAFWLKCRALKACCLAKHRSDGKSLPVVEGTTPDSFADYLAAIVPSRLPDPEARPLALSALRAAALRLPEMEAVQREAVHQEMQFEPKQWPLAQRVAQQLHSLVPKDDRAAYLLARFEFEQPVVETASGIATASVASRRSRERMSKALGHLQVVKAAEQPPRWRTLFLEAQVLVWLADHWRHPDHRRPEEEKQAIAALAALLFQEPSGALPRARAAGSFGALSRLDTEGVLYLHRLALDMAVEQARRTVSPPMHSDAPAVPEAFDALLAVAQRIAQNDPTPLQLGLCLDAAAQAAARAQPFLAESKADHWQIAWGKVEALAKQAALAQQGDLTSYVHLARILGQAPRNNAAALHWIEEGLRIAGIRQQPAAAQLGLHDMALRLKASSGAMREDIALHLSALKASENPRDQASAFLYEGGFLEREGKLEKAMDSLDRAARLAPGSHVALRAHAVMACLGLVLDRPNKALLSLAEMDKVYERWERLAPEERAWLESQFRSQAEVQMLKVQAHLACARQAYREMCRQAAETSKDSTEKMLQHEQAAAALLESFQEPHRRLAREQVVLHLLQTRRQRQAMEHLAALRQEHPLEVSLLRLKHLAELLTSGGTPNGMAQADDEIKQLLRAQPANQAAKLYWVEWQLITGREQAAAKYLAEPGQFPSGQADPAVARLWTLAQMAMGSARVASPVTEQPASNLVQVGHTATAEPSATDLPLARFENPALRRCRQAQEAALRKDFAEAAKGFASCLEITRLRPVAQAGLRQVLFAFAAENPIACRELVARLLQEMPAEPTLLLGYAECCFLLGEFGGADSKSLRVQDLVTALAAYEQATLHDSPSAGPWVKAQYWRRANRPDVAAGELARLLARDPEHAGGILLAAELALEANDPEGDAEALRLIERLEKARPASPQPCLLRGQVLQRQGKQAEALAAFKAALARQANCGPAFQGMVAIRSDSGDLEAAFAVIRQWRVACPEDPLAVQAEIRHLAATGQLAACRDLRDGQVRRFAASLPSGDAEGTQALLTLTLCQGLVEARQWTEADAWLKELAERHPNLEALWLMIGEVATARCRTAELPAARLEAAKQARDAFARVYSQRKGHVVAGNNLAWLLATNFQEPEEALRILREVQANRYTSRPMPAEGLSAALLDTFGVVYGQLESSDLTAEQLRMFQAARQRYPFDPRFALYLGRALLRAGRSVEAREQLLAAESLASRPRTGLQGENMDRFRSELVALKARLK